MKRQFEDFEVNSYTMAVIGEYREDGYIQSRIIETENEFVVPLKPLSIIDKSCRYFGSSLKGRLEGTKEVIGITHKPPIVIDAISGIYMFPITSPSKEDCSWVAHSYIKNVESYGQSQTLVTFLNQKEIVFHVSRGSFENQLHRTAQFRFLLSKRINSNAVSSYY